MLISWDHNRINVLTDEQYDTAKSVFMHYAPLFFPNASKYPSFVPMQPEINLHSAELKGPPSDSDSSLDPWAAPISRKRKSVEELADQPLAKKRKTAASFGIDMDADLDFTAPEQKADDNIEGELKKWFDPSQTALRWFVCFSCQDFLPSL
jgi:hypothetical protein